MDDIPEESDDRKEIEFPLKIPSNTLRELENNLEIFYGKNHQSVNGYICKKIEMMNKDFQLQHLSTSLLFDGKKPRKDVLENLLGIAIRMEQKNEFLVLKRGHIEEIINKELEKCDPRTFRKYLNCITDFVEKSTGRHVYYDQNYNLENFRKAILEHLHQLEQKSNDDSELD